MSQPRPEDVAQALRDGIAPSTLLTGTDEQSAPADEQHPAEPHADRAQPR